MSLLCLTCAKCKVVIFKIKINFLLPIVFNPQHFRKFPENFCFPIIMRLFSE